VSINELEGGANECVVEICSTCHYGQFHEEKKQSKLQTGVCTESKPIFVGDGFRRPEIHKTDYGCTFWKISRRNECNKQLGKTLLGRKEKKCQ